MKTEEILELRPLNFGEEEFFIKLSSKIEVEILVANKLYAVNGRTIRYDDLRIEGIDIYLDKGYTV